MLGRRLFASCAICAAMGLVADDASAQGAPGMRRNVLTRRDGPVDGYETLEVLIEIDPNFLVDWHVHPGTEAGYTVEGGGEFHMKGEAAETIKPGSSWVVPPGTPHVFRNGSQLSKLAVTFTVEKGKPLATPVAAPA